MPFDAVTRAVLEHFTTNPPHTKDAWYGPWIAILTTLFPTTQGYIVTPQRRLPDDPQSHIADLVIEVMKMATAPLIFRTVLIVKIRNSQHWEDGIPALERQLKRQTDAAFTGTAYPKVYWIGAIGPHWKYGERIDGQDVRVLVDWHDTTHDQASFDDLQTLSHLVAAL